MGLWALGQSRRHRDALAAQRRAMEELQNAQAKAALDHGQALKSGKAQLKTTEIALAAQKKKNFDQHQQLQEALAQGRAAQARVDEAIAEAHRARREAEAALLHADAPARKSRQAKTEPAPESAPLPAPAAAPSEPSEPTELPNAADEAQQALSQALAAAEQAIADMRGQQQALQQDLKEARRREARQAKRIEDLRRVDLMSRGKIEVLEDKLKRLGRELYEAISALAVAKGQVGPVPSPRSRPRQPQPAKEQGENLLANGHVGMTARQEAKLS